MKAFSNFLLLRCLLALCVAISLHWDICDALRVGQESSDVYWDPVRIEKSVKPAVVSIHMRTEVPLEGNPLGEFFATGFVVDSQFGIIATNRHVSGTSPSYYQVGFFDGSSRDATLLWYDPMEDFAFLRITPDEKGDMPPLRAVNITKAIEPVQAGDSILLIGNNEGKDFSVKRGQIASLRRHSASRRNLFIQTTLDRTGGASGSPIFDSKFDVVAIHAAGTDTTSMEIPIRLLASCLEKIVEQLKKSSTAMLRLPRGEIGARYSVESVGNAVRYYGLPEDFASKEMNRQLGEISDIRTGSPPCVPVVAALVPRLPAIDSLNPGDVIVKVGKEAIGCDLSKIAASLDEALADDTASPTVDIEIIRLGKRMTVSVSVIDANDFKVQRAAQIAGSVFQDITPGIRILFVGDQSGVWLSYAAPGSPLEEIGQSDDDSPGKTEVLVTAVNGRDVSDLDELVAAFDDVMSSDKDRDIFVTMIDYKLDELTPRATTVSLTTSRASAMWQFDSSSREWSHRTLFAPKENGAKGDVDPPMPPPTTTPSKRSERSLKGDNDEPTPPTVDGDVSHKKSDDGDRSAKISEVDDIKDYPSAPTKSQEPKDKDEKSADASGSKSKGDSQPNSKDEDTKEESARDTGVRDSSSDVQIDSLTAGQRFQATASSSLAKKRPATTSKSLRTP